MPDDGPDAAARRAAELTLLRHRLYRPDPTEQDVRRYRAAAVRGAETVPDAGSDRAVTAAATGRRAGWVLGGAAVAVGIAALAATLPLGGSGPAAPASQRAAAPVALRAPTTDGVLLWRSHGIGSLPSSPVLQASGTPIVVAIACRGAGAVLVLADNEDRRLTCVDGRVSTDRELFVAPHGRFTIALSISAPVEWDLTVHEVGG